MFILIEYLLKCSIQLKFFLYLIELKRRKKMLVKKERGEEKVRRKKGNTEQTNWIKFVFIHWMERQWLISSLWFDRWKTIIETFTYVSQRCSFFH